MHGEPHHQRSGGAQHAGNATLRPRLSRKHGNGKTRNRKKRGAFPEITCSAFPKWPSDLLDLSCRVFDALRRGNLGESADRTKKKGNSSGAVAVVQQIENGRSGGHS